MVSSVKGREVTQFSSCPLESQLNQMRVELDIGSGSGAFLECAAAADPFTQFLGVELDAERHYEAISRLRRGGVRNADSVHSEAYAFVRQSLPLSSIDVVHIYFPNPHPHEDGLDHRLIDFHFMSQIRRVLKDGGQLRLATDHASYFNDIVSQLEPGSWWGIEWQPLLVGSVHDGLRIGTPCEIKYKIEKKLQIHYLQLVAI
jgi:tRNA G46 methylase TrmB